MSGKLHALMIIAVMGAVTLVTRILPALIFGRKEKVPALIRYLGQTVPYTAMGLLIVYCLRDVSVTEGSHGLPELIALSAVAASYLWKRNTILSVAMGSVLYIVLIQNVF